MPAGFLPTLTLCGQEERVRSHPLQDMNLYLQVLVSWLFSFATTFVAMTPVELVYLITRKWRISPFSFRPKSPTEQFLVNTSPLVKALGILLACRRAGMRWLGRSIRIRKRPSSSQGQAAPPSTCAGKEDPRGSRNFSGCWQCTILLSRAMDTSPARRWPGDGSQRLRTSHRLLLFRWGPGPGPPKLALQQPEPELHSQHQTWQLELPWNVQLPKSKSAIMIPLCVAEEPNSKVMAYNTKVFLRKNNKSPQYPSKAL